MNHLNPVVNVVKVLHCILQSFTPSLTVFYDNREDLSFLESTLGRQAIITLHVKGIIYYVLEHS